MHDIGKSPRSYDIINPTVLSNRRTINLVKKVVAEFYEQPLTDYDELSKRNKKKLSREEPYIQLRRMAMYVLKYVSPKISLNLIGRAFGTPDIPMNHATVLHHQKTMQNLCDVDPKLKQEAMHILEILNTKHRLQGFSSNKDFDYEDLKDVRILRVSETQMVIFSGIDDAVVNKIKELHFKKAPVSLDQLKNTALLILDRKPK